MTVHAAIDNGITLIDTAQAYRTSEALVGQALKKGRQPRYNLLDRQIESDILPYYEAEGIGILAHSPLAKGVLTGKYAPSHQFPENDERSGMSRFQGEEFRRNLEKAHPSRKEGDKPPTPLDPIPKRPFIIPIVRHEVPNCWWLKVPLEKCRPGTFHTESWAQVGNGMG